MGQANSRGAAGPSAATPATSSSLHDDASVPTSHPTTVSSFSRSRQRRFTPFSRLSSEPSDAGSSGSNPPPLLRRHSRLHRARSTLSTAIPSIFARRPSPSRIRDEEPRPRPVSIGPTTTLRRPRPTPRHAVSDSNRMSLPPLSSVPDLDLDFDDITTSIDGGDTLERSRTLQRRESWRPASFLSDRRRPDRSLRSMTSSLRRRRSPTRRDNEDHATMLSRILWIAAAGTAASLMGEGHATASEARSVGNEEDDGTFESFLRSLQNGRIASALRQSTTDPEDSNQEGVQPPPLNFFRMFRFGSSAPSERQHESQPDESGDEMDTGVATSSPQSDGDEDTSDNRMVPIIIVGISSMTPGNGSNQETNFPPFLDLLSNFPRPLTTPGESTIDGILRQPHNGTSFSHRRRTSMGASNTLPGGYDNQRQPRSPLRPPGSPTLVPEVENLLSGRRPPPSTPASAGLSAVSSGAATPTHSPSVSSQSTPSRRNSVLRRTTSAGLNSTVEEGAQTQQRLARQRQPNDPDHTRFGSGSARRNGVVEPDNSPGDGSRSWVIYVFGGSYPENHPILTAPSLYTDSPTYEDMLLLSALLGTVKPPVASEEDVASAPGLFRIQARPLVDGSCPQLIAVAVDGEATVAIAAEERCLVCLTEYEVDEEARQILQCGHLFHRECIDQVRTSAGIVLESC